MTEDSGFFSLPTADEIMTMDQMELISAGAKGWCELYRVDRGGKFRVLKALKEEFRGQQRYEALLRKEFDIGYSLSHPQICETYSFMETKYLGNVIEMEWVDGLPLEKVLEDGSLTKKEAQSIAFQILDALAYIHSRQVIHRDIKPSNIIITHNGRNVKILDFGLADTDYHSVLKSPGGTKSYAAPELIQGREVDLRADVYSFGKVLEKLLPWEKRVIRRCTQKDPLLRYGNCTEVKRALAYRSRKYIPWIFILLASLLAILLTGYYHLARNGQAQEKTDNIEELQEVQAPNPEVIDELFRQATDIITPSVLNR